MPNGGVVRTSRLATSMRRLGEATGNLTSVGEHLGDGYCGGRKGRVNDRVSPTTLRCPALIVNRLCCVAIFGHLSLCEKIGVNMPLFPRSAPIYLHHARSLRWTPIKAQEVALPMW